jgi:hypothetical protein
VNPPPEKAPVSTEQLRSIENLPLPLAAMMMQQISRADRLFPIERGELNSTLQSLMAPRSKPTEQAVEMFAALRLSPELQRYDWRSDPAGFAERMTAELWRSNQIETFRNAAKLLAPSPSALEPGSTQPASRFVVIVLDRRLRAAAGSPTLFRRLRPFGTCFSHAADDRGMETLERWITARASADAEPYAHWKIAGDVWNRPAGAPVVSLSYDGLSAERRKLLAFFNTARNTATSGGPEGLRQALLHLTPEQIGLTSIDDPVLRTFATDIFTEGSGTQLYSTTFVQWAIREALRRAQPRSLLARFSPRSQATSMDMRIAKPELEPPLDDAGSLIDAEMGAYLSYVNLMRLPDSNRASFLVWHEGYGQALLISRGMPQGSESSSAMTLERILALSA